MLCFFAIFFFFFSFFTLFYHRILPFLGMVSNSFSRLVDDDIAVRKIVNQHRLRTHGVAAAFVKG